MQTSTNSQVETRETECNPAAVNSNLLESQKKKSTEIVRLAGRATKDHHRKIKEMRKESDIVEPRQQAGHQLEGADRP
jgi:uncharacterized Fe-S cluster-containing radical SAM superfamily protein